MARVQVTSANDNTTRNGDRCIVRNSSGIPYIVIEDHTDYAIEVWKGNSATPTSFSEQDAAHRPVSAGRYGSPSAAIDSTGIIHIVYSDDNGSSPAVRYVTFNTSTDLFAGDVVLHADLGEDMTSVANMQTAIAVDANDIPHIMFVGNKKSGGTSYYILYYNNRIGGAWNVSPITAYGSITDPSNRPHLSIDNDGKTFASHDKYYLSGNLILGDANDATTFEAIEYYNYDDYELASVAVDGDGNHYVGYKYTVAPDYVSIMKHNKADSWATWVRVNNGIEPFFVSLTLNDTDCYTIYINYPGDSYCHLVYDKYSGTWGSGSWLGQTNILTGATTSVRFSGVRSKWARYVDYDSTGINRAGTGGRQEIDYVYVEEPSTYTEYGTIYYDKIFIGPQNFFVTESNSVGITTINTNIKGVFRTIISSIGITDIASKLIKRVLTGVVRLVFKLF